MTRYTRASILIASLVVAHASVAAPAAQHWVRVETTADRLAQASGRRIDSADYGRFQWLAVDDATLVRLQAAGLAVREFEAPFDLDLGGMRLVRGRQSGDRLACGLGRSTRLAGGELQAGVFGRDAAGQFGFVRERRVVRELGDQRARFAQAPVRGQRLRALQVVVAAAARIRDEPALRQQGFGGRERGFGVEQAELRLHLCGEGQREVVECAELAKAHGGAAQDRQRFRMATSATAIWPTFDSLRASR